MPGHFTVRHSHGLLSRGTDDHDWMAEFPQESQPKSRLLAAATTHTVVARTPPPTINTINTIAHARPHRSILLTLCAAVLMISAGSAVFLLWMRVSLAPLPLAEWPVSPAIPSSRTAAVPSATAVSPALEPQPTPTPVTPSAPARAASTPVSPVAPATKAPAPAVAEEEPVASGTSDVSAILSVLDRYRLAFSSHNPGSVRAVAFDNCRIDVQGAQAAAICAGRVSLVTGPGSQGRNIQPRRWTFSLARQADTWKIRTVDSQ
jgi:hypothetical protein